MTLIFKATDQTLVPIPTNVVPRDGSRKYLFLEFDIGNVGKEFTVTAYLHRDEDDEGYAEIYDGNPLEVPPYFTQSSGFLLHLGFVSGEISYTTNDVAVSLNAASKKWTSLPPSVEIPAYQQLVQKAEEARKAAEEAKKAAKEASKRTGLPVAVAESGNGATYEVDGDALPDLVVGRQFVMIPMDTNTKADVYLSVNGGEYYPIRLRAAEADGATSMPVPVGALLQNVPYTLTFAGDFWLVDSIFGGGNKNDFGRFYEQADEPTDAKDGDWWLDTDENPCSEGNLPSGDFVTRPELKEAVQDALDKGVLDLVSKTVEEEVKGITPGQIGALPADTKIPSKTSELTNDAGFLTTQDLPSGGGDGWKHAGSAISETDGEVLTISGFSSKKIRIAISASIVDTSTKTRSIVLNDKVNLIDTVALSPNGVKRLSVIELNLMSDGTNNYLYSTIEGTQTHNAYTDEGAKTSIYAGTTSGKYTQKVPIEKFESVKLKCSNGTLSAGSSISVDYQ